MTVSTELSHEEYVGNGVTTDFDFRFRIFEGKHLIVVVADSDGNEKTLKNGTDYTIVGAGSYHGGKVVLNKPLAQGWKILLERDLPVVQETDLRNQGKFFAEVHEDAFDYLTMLIQKALGTFSLSLRKPTYLSNYYDAKGNRIANLAPPKFGSDSANKDYVDNSIKDIDSNTLRVKDKPINALPNTEQRANKILAFDDNGQPIMVLPESNSASDVLIELAKPEGAKLIGFGNNHTVNDLSLHENGDGDSLIAVKQPFHGAIPRNQHDKNAENLSLWDFGIIGDGVHDDSTALQNYINASNFDIFVPSDMTLYISENIISDDKIKIHGGGKIIGDKNNKPSLFLSNGGVIDGMYLESLSINAFTNESLLINDKNGFSFLNNNGVDYHITVGAPSSSVKNVLVTGNKGMLSGNRNFPFLKLINVSNYVVSRNTTQEYHSLITVIPHRSFCNYNGEISFNNDESYIPFELIGDSVNCISGINIHSNTLSHQVRNASTSESYPILKYCNNVTLSDNTLTFNFPVSIEYCRHITMSNNKLVSGSLSSSLRFWYSKNCIIINNDFNFSSSDAVCLILSGYNNALERSENIRVSNNKFHSKGRFINIASGSNNVCVNSNVFYNNIVNSHSNIYISSDSTNINVYENKRVALSSNGNLIQDDSSSAITSPPSNNDVITHGSLIVKELFVGKDADLNNSNAYIYSISAPNVSFLKAKYETDGKGLAIFKTMTEWMSGTSAELAINMSAFDSDVSKFYDGVMNGGLVDCYGGEFYFRPSAAIINNFGELFCRDWTLKGDTGTESEGYGTPQRNIANGMISEGVFQTFIFRSPLVVDGKLYDYKRTGIVNRGVFEDGIEPRMSIGQKKDGTIIIICVDGRRSDSPGCTMLSLANKFISLGCNNAFNTDGGGSATLWYKGKVINKPSDGVERKIPTVFYV
ncbi:phosphodiester glycosidase family protein [Proteus mirabilis]|uniref:phosphodiester glycosidase family protein n=1 Tax=Proteus mirabilis TaxID=584 RepID=UPI003D044A5B